jgi:hypothetical protein
MAANRVRLINGKWYTEKENPLGISPPEAYTSNRPGFQNQAEMVEAMKDPRYETEEGYRQQVYKMIGESDAVELGLEQRPYVDGGDQVEAVKDGIVQLFGDERYATSPLYRMQVANLIKNDPDIDRAFVRPLNPLGKGARYQVKSEVTGPDAPAPKPRFNPDGMGDDNSAE